MTDREFLEKIERDLRAIAHARPHGNGSSSDTFASGPVCLPYACERCRLQKLADEVADRAFRSAA